MPPEVARLLSLQRLAGNAAVGRGLLPVQRQIVVGPVPRYEGFLAACESVGLEVDDRGSEVFVYPRPQNQAQRNQFIANTHLHLSTSYPAPNHHAQINSVLPKTMFGAHVRPQLVGQPLQNWAGIVANMVPAAAPTTTATQLLVRVLTRNGVFW